LARLEPRDRELLALRYVAGFSAPELAEYFRLTPEGIRSRAKRLLDRLRTELDR
jgi:RNA polymerase sigma factor (sigma-70 family)